MFSTSIRNQSTPTGTMQDDTILAQRITAATRSISLRTAPKPMAVSKRGADGRRVVQVILDQKNVRDHASFLTERENIT